MAEPDSVSRELTRVVRRWRELPVERAEAAAPTVRSLVAELAGQDVPELGPAVLMDQLRVLVFDATADPQYSADVLADRLRQLRSQIG